jgi:putative membrane protein
MILIFKAIHIIGFVAWFAGLFYLVRMFVYHVEADEQEQPARDILKNQFHLMEQRVYNIICLPALYITLIAGIGMLAINHTYLYMGWMQVKTALLLLLIGYHFYCGQIIKRLHAGSNSMTSWQFRLFNEFPTLFLVVICFIAVQGKAGTLHYGKLTLGMGVFIFLLWLGARSYKRYRDRRAN